MPFFTMRRDKRGKGRGLFASRNQDTFDRVMHVNSNAGQASPGRDAESRGVTTSGTVRGARSDKFAAARAPSGRRNRAGGGSRHFQRENTSPCRSPGDNQSYGGNRRERRVSDVTSLHEAHGLVLFWKNPSLFTQWTPSPFTVDGEEFLNAEQYMMAGKARLFGDTETRMRIMNTSDPSEQKSLGRAVKGFEAAVWDEKGYDIVVKGNLEKFKQNPSFQEALLATGDKIIAEASPFDNVWGIGLRSTHPDAVHQQKWPGQNKLGEALMEVRRQIREELYLASVDGGAEDAANILDEEWASSDEDKPIGQNRL